MPDRAVRTASLRTRRSLSVIDAVVVSRAADPNQVVSGYHAVSAVVHAACLAAQTSWVSVALEHTDADAAAAAAGAGAVDASKQALALAAASTHPSTHHLPPAA